MAYIHIKKSIPDLWSQPSSLLLLLLLEVANHSITLIQAIHSFSFVTKSL